MRVNFPISGLMVPIFVPYKENGKINFAEYQRFIDFLFEKGANGIFVCGTSGEFIHQSVKERLDLLTAAREAAPKQMTLMYNISSLSFLEIEQYVDHANAMNVDAVSIIAPWYYKHSHQSLIAFFSQVSKISASQPLYFYNFPDRTGNPITPDLLAALTEHCPNLCGGKDSSKSYDQLMQYRSVVRDDFTLVTGDDMQIFASAMLGNRAAISGMGNVVPELISKIFTLIDAKKFDAALQTQRQINHIKSVIARSGSLMGYKQAAGLRGFAMGPMRLPFVSIDPKIEEEIRACLGEFLP